MADNSNGGVRRGAHALLLAGTSALVLSVLGGVLPSVSTATAAAPKLSGSPDTSEEICQIYGQDSPECIAALSALAPAAGAAPGSSSGRDGMAAPQAVRRE